MTRRGFLYVCGAATLSAAEVERIKVGQIGTGHAHAAGKMAALRGSAEFEVVGICEPDAARRASAEKQKVYAGLPWLTEAELFAVPGLRAVAVETSVSDLLATAQRGVEAGFHLHLDKPAGESFPAYRRLLAEASRRKLVVQMGYMFRHNPAFEHCAKLVREGTLGDIFSIEAAMSKKAGNDERAALRPYRGGAMFELGCHLIERAVSLLGKPARVDALNRPAPQSTDGFFDNGLAVLEYPKATATIRSSLLEVGGMASRHFTVCGTRGTFSIQPLEPAQAVLTLDSAEAQTITLPKTRGRYDGDFAELAAVLRGEREFPWTVEHDLATQETVLLASGLPLT